MRDRSGVADSCRLVRRPAGALPITRTQHFECRRHSGEADHGIGGSLGSQEKIVRLPQHRKFGKHEMLEKGVPKGNWCQMKMASWVEWAAKRVVTRGSIVWPKG